MFDNFKRLTGFGWFSFLSLAIGVLILVCAASSCTISFQNFDTHGETLEEMQQTTEPDISTQATIPLKG